MATYQELFELRNESILLNKVTYAIVVKCKLVLNNGTSNAAQKAWAIEGSTDPESKKAGLLWSVLNNQAWQTKENIIALSDEDIQFAVSAAIDEILATL